VFMKNKGRIFIKSEHTMNQTSKNGLHYLSTKPSIWVIQDNSSSFGYEIFRRTERCNFQNYALLVFTFCTRHTV